MTFEHTPDGNTEQRLALATSSIDHPDLSELLQTKLNDASKINAYSSELPALSFGNGIMELGQLSSKPDADKNASDATTHLEIDTVSESQTSEVIQLKLQHGSGQKTSPDAIVRMPKDFDTTEPIHLLLYNHGFYDSAESSFTNAKLDAQMQNAPANTILIEPEWQASPKAANSNQGNFSETNMFKDMLQEIFTKIPSLEHKTLNDVDTISIISHSAGYEPTATEINNNGLIDKVKSITMLDSLYNGPELDNWLKNNTNDLSNGKAQYTNIFTATGGTESNSKEEAERVLAMFKGKAQHLVELLQKAALSPAVVFEDYDHGDQLMTPAEMASHPVIFKFSSATVDNLGTHMSLPNLYVSVVEQAANGGGKNTGSGL